MTKPQLPPGVIPIGATHFHHNPMIDKPTSNPWRKKFGEGWLAFYDGEWRGCNGSKAHLFVAIEDVLGSPTSGEWDGYGFPPVGTVCEYRADGWPEDQWEVRTIMYVSEYHIITKEEDGTERRIAGNKARFRLLRTAEEIAAEERLHEIRNALTTIKAGQSSFPNDIVRGNITIAVVEAMIDAGYRKQVRQ